MYLCTKLDAKWRVKCFKIRNYAYINRYLQAQKRQFPIIKMTEKIKQKIIKVCNEKIDKKGENVGLSFYAFFANKNDSPELFNGSCRMVDFET